jgi:hypothetical protein
MNPVMRLEILINQPKLIQGNDKKILEKLAPQSENLVKTWTRPNPKKTQLELTEELPSITTKLVVVYSFTKKLHSSVRFLQQNLNFFLLDRFKNEKYP